MTESQYIECNASRSFNATTFLSGSLEFPFNVGVPNGWVPSKSYVRIGATLNGASGTAAPDLSEFVALADNVGGNLFSNAYVRIQGQSNISQCTAGLDRASALCARLEHGDSWLKSLGAGSTFNIAKFSKRNEFTATESPADAYLGAENEMYRPTSATNFAAAQVSISAAATTTLTALTNVTQAAATTASFVRGPVSGVVTDPVVVAAGQPNPESALLLANAVTVVAPLVLTGAANNALATFTPGGIVTGVNTLFSTGMPGAFNGAITGFPVRVGDILVVGGIYYPVITAPAGGSETAFTVSNPPAVAVGATSDWYIIRKDMLRAPQAKNIVYINYQPPLGIFKHSGYLGGGDYQLLLQPNAQYQTAAVETKNIDALTGATLPYALNVNSVRLYIYVEKVQIPPSVQDLSFLEYQVQSKPWQANLQFTVSPYTESLTFFVQDNSASYDPRVTPSMFKCYDNSDLQLQQIQCSYAGYTKPDIPWVSNFYGTPAAAFDSFQQRYLSSYEESGSDVKSQGCETYSDFLTRGPFYHFAFVRDQNYRATEVSLNTTFGGSGAPTGINGQPADIYCISHYRTSVQITTAAGRIVHASMIGQA